jgi:hypothetical protein
MPAVILYLLLWGIGLVAGIAGAPVFVIVLVALGMACLAFRHEARHFAKRVSAPIGRSLYRSPLPPVYPALLHPVPVVAADHPHNS